MRRRTAQDQAPLAQAKSTPRFRPRKLPYPDRVWCRRPCPANSWFNIIQVCGPVARIVEAKGGPQAFQQDACSGMVAIELIQAQLSQGRDPIGPLLRKISYSIHLQKKVALGHRQHLRWLTGEQLAIGKHLVGLRIHLDPR